MPVSTVTPVASRESLRSSSLSSIFTTRASCGAAPFVRPIIAEPSAAE